MKRVLIVAAFCAASSMALAQSSTGGQGGSTGSPTSGGGGVGGATTGSAPGVAGTPGPTGTNIPPRAVDPLQNAPGSGDSRK